MRLWALLVVLGLLGYLGALPFFAHALAGGQLPVSVPVLLAAQGLQLLLLLALAAFAGVKLAPRSGLDAPFLRALSARTPLPSGFARVAVEALLIGTVASALTIGVLLLLRPYVPLALSKPPGTLAPAWVRASSVFYGGIAEEILLRWGVLTALVALARKAGVRAGFWAANFATAILFGASHLPAVRFMRLQFSAPVVAYVVLGNLLAGLAFGWLFRRRGLESAMVAHGVTDIWIQMVLVGLL